MTLPGVNWVVNNVAVPVTAGLPLATDTVPCSPGGMLTVPPLAVHISVLLVIEQLIVPVPVVPDVLTGCMAYVAPLLGKSSVSNVCVFANVAEPELAALMTIIDQLNALPTVTCPLTLLVLLAVRSVKLGIVLLTVGDVTPPLVAEAVFVTNDAVTSAATTV